jgi:hypothetical protein
MEIGSKIADRNIQQGAAMITRTTFVRSAIAMAAAGCLSAPGAWAAESAFPQEPGLSSGQPGQAVGPAQSVVASKNNELFKQLRETCDKEVPIGKASPEACVDAAAILVGGDLPDEFREFKEDQRIKIALRLLERATEHSDLARARAYDYYDKIGFLGMSTYADPYRARELMDMMVKSGYPGASLRKIRSQTTILSFGASEAEKRVACTEAKRMLKEVKLDADSTRIAQDVVGSGICTGYDAVPIK